MNKYYKYLPWIPIIGLFLSILVALTNDVAYLGITMDKPKKYWGTLIIQVVSFVAVLCIPSITIVNFFNYIF